MELICSNFAFEGTMKFCFEHAVNDEICTVSEGNPVPVSGDGTWKLIRFFEGGRGARYEELYNLKEDIGETKNLAEAEPDKRAEFSSCLTVWQGEIETCASALIPEPNPECVPWDDREASGHFGCDSRAWARSFYR